MSGATLGRFDTTGVGFCLYGDSICKRLYIISINSHFLVHRVQWKSGKVPATS